MKQKERSDMRLVLPAAVLTASVLLGVGCGKSTDSDTQKPVTSVAVANTKPSDSPTPVATKKAAVGFTSITGIHFDSMEKITKAERGQKKYKTTFKFTNAGSENIHITEINSTCVCTVTELEKRVYAPGEQGEITTEIAFGQAKGKFSKHIYVTVKSGDKIEMLTLSIGAIIPEFARITPRFIRWEHGEAATAKTINVKIIHDEPIKVLKVTSSNPEWRTTFRTVKEGKEYSVEVTPPNTKKASRAAVLIEMDYPEKQPLVFKAVARVLQPPAPEPETEGWMKKLLKQDP